MPFIVPWEAMCSVFRVPVSPTGQTDHKQQRFLFVLCCTLLLHELSLDILIRS